MKVDLKPYEYLLADDNTMGYTVWHINFPLLEFPTCDKTVDDPIDLDFHFHSIQFMTFDFSSSGSTNIINIGISYYCISRFRNLIEVIS